MDIQKRARVLNDMIAKQTPPSPISSTPSNLFPKLQGINKPPNLTSSSQPPIDVARTELPTLPKMRVNGSNPKFTSTMQSGDPYNKY